MRLPDRAVAALVRLARASWADVGNRYELLTPREREAISEEEHALVVAAFRAAPEPRVPLYAQSVTVVVRGPSEAGWELMVALDGERERIAAGRPWGGVVQVYCDANGGDITTTLHVAPRELALLVRAVRDWPLEAIEQAARRA